MFKITRKELNRLYWKEGLSKKQIAEIKDTSISTISRRMKKHKISARTISEASKSITKKSFNKDLKKWCGKNLVQLIEDYDGSSNEAKFKCECGHIFFTTRHKITDIYREKGVFNCPMCREGKKDWNYIAVKKYFESRDCQLLSKIYKNSHQKLNYICSCGNKSKISFTHFLNGHRCNKCGTERMAAQYRHDFQYVKKYFEQQDCELLSEEYKNSNTKLKYRCSCGNISYTYFSIFIKGHRCMVCSGDRSRGEERIIKYLNENDINYNKEQKFKDLNHKYPLRYDFAIEIDGKITKLIEYDGRQHFEPVEWFGGIKNYKKRKERDKIKNEYAKRNNIPLIRIPYWEFDNIEKILEKELTS